MDANVLRQSLDAINKAQRTPMTDPRLSDALAKSTFVQPGSAVSGLNFYDLELGAKFLFPVLTPLRNEIPRVAGKGGIQAAWRAVTGINTTGVRAGVSGGNRGGVIAVSTQDYTAAYKGLGLEDNVDFEAQYAGMGFDDIRAIAAKTLLEATMLQEEYVILGGNNSAIALGTTPTPVNVGSSTGGAMTNATISVICVALAFDAVLNGSVTGGIQASITRTNADASTDTFGGGSAQKSAAQSTVLAGGTSTQSIATSVTPVKGAFGYAWFWGVAGSELLGAITSAPLVTITTNLATGTQTAASLPASDQSQNSLVFDGLLYQALKSGSNAYVKAVSGTLTADNAGGINEIETALQSMWDNFRLGPDTMWVNSQQALDISRKILAGGATGAQRFVFNSVQDALNAGVMVRSYLNRFSMQGGSTIDIKIHPNMPAGVILMTSKKLPYPISNVGNVVQVRTRQDYYQIEWPLRSRKYEYGVYMDEVLQHFFPPSMAVLWDVRPG